MRKRPSAHIRKVKTRRGKKTVLVNRHIKKTKPKGRISKNDRKLFKFISDPKNYDNLYEYGGAIDFDKKGKVENILIIPGMSQEVWLPEDFEVQYHTHPDSKENPPSPDDILALLKNNRQKAEIVFRKGIAFVVVKTKTTKALSKLPTTQLYKKLDEAFHSSYLAKGWEDSYKKKLQDMGFMVYIDKNIKDGLDVHVKPFEPKNKRKTYEFR